MLTLAKTVRTGESTVTDVTRAAGALRVALDVRKGVDLHHMPVERVPLSACASADCVIFFGSAPWDEHGLVYDLQIKNEKLRKWMRWNTLSAAVSTSKGVVQDLDVYALSVDDKVAHTAISEIAADRNTSPWTIQRRGGGFKGPGEVMVGMDGIQVQATSDAVNRRKVGALDFDLRCMGLTKHCSACQLLPFACQDYEHGDWFYFEMSGDLLNNFQIAVNELPLGTSLEAVENRLGAALPFGRQLFKDKLPYSFPEGTVFENTDTRRLFYYVKRRRENEGDSQDRTVTMVFDKNDKLARVESQVDAIRSRP
ncbi:MAG TPA: hypothetical protein VJX69_15825 [Terriglobales bacterium]|nr:hypothetical protein [Terriglobales bacterium]